MTDDSKYDLYGPQTNKYTLYGPHFKANAHQIYAAMRRDDPICPHIEGGMKKWFVTRYEDIQVVLQDHQRFIKSYARFLEEEEAETPKEDTPENVHQLFFSKNLLKQDIPEHTRLRSLVNKAFSPRMVRKMRTPIQNIADQLIDQVQSRGEMDVINEYGFPLSVAVIAGILGVSTKDQELFREAAEALITPLQTPEEVKRSKQILFSFKEYLKETFADRRQNPRDDLMTQLVQVQEAGDKLSEIELYSITAELIAAGHETTIHLVGNGLLAFLQHPQQLQKVKRDPSLMEAAVEEILRYDCPVDRSTPRYAAEDIEFHGHTIRRGEQVLVVVCSANRDSEKFENPETFDIMREDNRHLAFGYGIHYCLGAALARLEGKIALNTLLQRLPNLRLNASLDELEWHTIPLTRGLKNLPVVWDT